MAIKKIGGIWKREKDGKRFLSIGFSPGSEQYPGPSLDDISAQILAGDGFIAYINEYKEDGDKKPDYNLCMITQEGGNKHTPQDFEKDVDDDW